MRPPYDKPQHLWTPEESAAVAAEQESLRLSAMQRFPSLQESGGGTMMIEELTEKLRQTANFLEDTAPPEYQDLTAAVRRAHEMLAQARLQAKAASLAPAIVAELYRALERLDADPDLLAIVNSWNDTLDDKEVLRLLKDWNETGKVLNERQ
jgi:hypothetical protein